MKSNETAVLNALQEQVNILKAQIIPEQDSEKLLDGLFQLQLKRQQEIIQDGFEVTFGAGEKVYKCLKADDDTLYFPTGTAVAASMHVKQNGHLLGIVASVTQQAGRLKCSIWVPKQTAQTFEKTATATGFNLKQSGPSTPCQLQGNTLTFYGKNFPTGSIISCNGDFLEVIGVRNEGALSIHKIKQYSEPEKPARALPKLGAGADDMPKGQSLYWSKFVM